MEMDFNEYYFKIHGYQDPRVPAFNIQTKYGDKILYIKQYSDKNMIREIRQAGYNFKFKFLK